MKKFNLISLLFLAIIFNVGAQDQVDISKVQKKHRNLGIQYNPYTSDFNDHGWVGALRYSRTTNFNLDYGIEYLYFKYYSSEFNTKEHRIGLFISYSFLPYKRITPYVEAASSAGIGTTTNNSGTTIISGGSAYSIYTFNYYFAPGVSFYTKNKMFSFNLFFKLFNPEEIIPDWKVTPSYRIAFHF